MSASTATLLSKVEDAISALLDVIADTTVEEYEIGGRKVRRPEFGRTLDVLIEKREMLRRIQAREGGSHIRVAKLGRPRVLDR